MQLSIALLIFYPKNFFCKKRKKGRHLFTFLRNYLSSIFQYVILTHLYSLILPLSKLIILYLLSPYANHKQEIFVQRFLHRILSQKIIKTFLILKPIKAIVILSFLISSPFTKICKLFRSGLPKV